MILNNLLMRGLIPDVLTRVGIRRLLQQRLDEIYKGGTESCQERLTQLLQQLKNSPIAVHTQEANEQHYEVPAAFYQKVLGPHLKYSCGYWEEGSDLAGAEALMLEKTLQRAQIEPGQTVLDLGCGWGSFSLYAAKRNPSCTFVALSNSHSQRAYIEAQARHRHIENLRVVTQDINVAQFEQRFDRVVSVEMFEHMRNYELLLAKISAWLKPGGKLFVHIFTHRQHPYLFEVKDETDWMSRYFFTGGIMPSDHLLLYFSDAFQLERHWRINGKHYQKTAEAWLVNMDAHASILKPLFQEVYGQQEWQRWWSYWRVFFMACGELWGFNEGNEWVVSHYLFQKRASRNQG